MQLSSGCSRISEKGEKGRKQRKAAQGRVLTEEAGLCLDPRACPVFRWGGETIIDANSQSTWDNYTTHMVNIQCTAATPRDDVEPTLSAGADTSGNPIPCVLNTRPGLEAWASEGWDGQRPLFCVWCIWEADKT